MLNSRCVLAFLFFSTFFFIAGCDKEENAADQRVSDNIRLARDTYYSKDGGPEKSQKLLEAAAKETAASNASKATAKALVGQSNYAMAVSHLTELNEAENEAMRAIREIGRIGSELGDEVSLIDSLKGSNPSASQNDPLKALSANKAKFAAQVAEFDKTIQQLQAKQQELTSKIASLDTEQKSKIEMGNQLLAKSEAAKGQESVDLFKQSAEVRKSAGMLAHDLEFARIDLKRTENLIADAQRERKVADESVAIAQNQIQQLNQSWAATEDAIKKRRAQAAELLTRAEVDASLKKGINAEGGIAALAKQFAAAKQRAADLRKSIDESNLDASIASYDEADRAAKSLTTALTTALNDEKNKETPVRSAWTRIKSLYDPITYQLGKARSLQLRGQLFLQEMNLLKAQQNVVASLQPLFASAGLAMPTELAPADLPAQLDGAKQTAKRNLTDAVNILKEICDSNVVMNNTWPQAGEARLAYATTRYALHYVDSDKPLDKGERDEIIGIIGGPEKITQSNFPALPPDLEVRAITLVPMVGGKGGPTTGPATNPTEGGGGGPAITPEGAAALKEMLKGVRIGTPAGGGGAQPQPQPQPQQNQ
jgi:hypothetical protein